MNQKTLNHLIKLDILDVANDINNFEDCDYIQECINNLFESSIHDDIKESIATLIQACEFRIGGDKSQIKYMKQRAGDLKTIRNDSLKTLSLEELIIKAGNLTEN